MIDQQPAMYVWAAAVTLAIVAGAWTGMNRRGIRPTLPPEHVAGAAIIGLFGWEMLVHLPGSMIGYWALTAGLGDVRGVEGHQAYVVAQAAFAIGAAFAVVGTLRRRTWGVVLGIGLASSRVVWSGLILFETVSMYGEIMGSDAYLSTVSSLIGMQAVPALAAIALLSWPLARRSDSEWPAAGASMEHAE